MSEKTTSLGVLKNRTVLIGIAVAVVVILIWLVVFFLPQGSKLSKLKRAEPESPGPSHGWKRQGGCSQA